MKLISKAFAAITLLLSVINIGHSYASYIEPTVLKGEEGELTMVGFPGDSVSPSPLIYLSYQVDSSIVHTRSHLNGYNNSNIKIEKNGQVLTITNTTPRVFSHIAFTNDIDGFVIPTRLEAFTTLTLSINEEVVGDKLFFLDPNPQYAYSPIWFGNNQTEDHVKAYQVINSGIKYFYTKKSSRDDFLAFLASIGNGEQEVLAKWIRTQTFDVPIKHQAFKNGALGVASLGPDWLSLNSPLTRFITFGGNYPNVYSTYHHEAAHTMDYPHGSGLAYGFDTYVQNGIAHALRNNELTPFEMVIESAPFYSFYSGKNNSVAFYYDPKNTTESIDDIDLTSTKYALKHAFANGNRIFFHEDMKGFYKVLLGISTKSGKLFHSFLNVGIAEKDRNPAYLYVGETGGNVYDVARNIFWFVPVQDSVISTQGVYQTQRGYWGSQGSHSKIVVAVKNEATQEIYNITVLGTKAGRLLGEGSTLNREVTFTYDQASLENLPQGVYSGEFDVVAAGWHVRSYNKRYPVKIKFTIGEPTILPLGEWSENFSKATVTGNSSVYFYIPEQESVIETTALRSENRAIWSGATADTKILVKAIGDDGKTYSLPLIGNKKGYTEMLMGDGAYKGFGQLRVKLDIGSDHYVELPYGQNYRATLVVKAASWHDNTQFPQNIVVPVAVYKQDPSEQASSVSAEFVIYDGFDYQGNAFTINSDVANLGSWANKMSSWTLPKGWEVRFYESENFTGGYYTRRQSGNAEGFNNKIRSVKILKRPHTETIVIYDQANRSGESRVITRDVANLGDWDNKLSSWFLPEGWEVRFYEQPNFEGSYWSLAKSGNADNFDKVVSSIKILKRPEQLVIFDGKGFSGNARAISADVAALGAWDGKLSSWMMPEGWEVRFFEHENFTGRYYTRRVNDNAEGFGYQISSIQILKRSDKLVISDVNGEAISINADLATLKDWDNRMTSWTIPEGWEVRFYESAHFSGPYYTRNVSGDATGFNRKISSIKILKRL